MEYVDYAEFRRLFESNAPISRIGNVEMFNREIEVELNNGKHYMVSYRNVFQVEWSNNTKSYVGFKVYHHDGDIPLTKRGRFLFMSGDSVNSLIGHNLLNN